MSQQNPHVKKLDALVELLRNPPVEYRPMPQWSWNGELSEEHIRQRLQQFADQGIGGLFAHARTNFVTGYISDRFFELWDFAAREAQRLGMQFQIYDEFCCPSGNAAGQVVAEKPHLARQELGISMFTGIGPRPSDETLAWFRIENGARSAGGLVGRRHARAPRLRPHAAPRLRQGRLRRHARQRSAPPRSDRCLHRLHPRGLRPPLQRSLRHRRPLHVQ